MQSPAPRLTWFTLLALTACGDSGGRDDASVGATGGPTEVTLTNPSSSGEDSGPTTTDGDAGSSGTSTSTGSGDACTAELCPEGECIDDACCPIELACTTQCCGAGQVCSFQQCVVPGAPCIDATECPEDNDREYSLGDRGMMGGDCARAARSRRPASACRARRSAPPGSSPRSTRSIACRSAR